MSLSEFGKKGVETAPFLRYDKYVCAGLSRALAHMLAVWIEENAYNAQKMEVKVL